MSAEAREERARVGRGRERPGADAEGVERQEPTFGNQQ